MKLSKILQFSVLAVGAVALGVSLNGLTAGKVKSQGASPSIFNTVAEPTDTSSSGLFNSVAGSADTSGGELFALVGGETQTSTTQPTHVINVTLTSPDDLKVKEGDLVKKGDVVSDRTLERQRLESKKQQLENAIELLSLPLTELSQLPDPNFDSEKAALKKARLKLDEATRAVENYPGLQFKDEALSVAMEPQKVKELARLKQRQLEASINLEAAVARLSEAKTRYQREKYQHSIQLAAYQTSLQRQQYQLASLVSQLQKVEDDLSKIVAVNSPYSGRVRRVKITGQNERLITAEITLDIRNFK